VNKLKLSNNLTIDNIYNSIVSRHPGIWGYDYDQKVFIRRVLEEGLDAKYIANPRFSREQMVCIYQGLKKGLDVKLYAKVSFSTDQMQLLRKALEEGYDIKSFAKVKFSYAQMKATIRGLMVDVDVTKSKYFGDWWTAEKINKTIDDELDARKHRQLLKEIERMTRR
jgi:hypothetical protein